MPEGNCQSDTDESESSLSPINLINVKRSTKDSIDIPRFDYVCHAKENHGYQLYGIAVSPFIRDKVIFSTVGHNRCTIYQLTDQTISLIACYSDDSSDENFYCCVWLYDSVNHDHLLAAAGKNGIIHILSPKLGASIKELKGHGNSVNELAVSPTDSNLLLSASKDNALRLWNVRSGVCVAIFGGINGHSDEVLSADFDISGQRILSAGIDHTIKIWNFANDDRIASALHASQSYDQNRERKAFKTVVCNFCDFSTKEIHSNYVDSARWFGDLIISKSCENTVTLWKPGDLNSLGFSSTESDVTKIRDFTLRNCCVWFMKMTISWDFKWLAVGNQSGKIYIWSLLGSISTKPRILQYPKCNYTIRQLAFSPDNNTLLAVCDDSSIWRWDVKLNR